MNLKHILMLCGATVCVSACSPSSLFDSGKDQKVLQTPTYRKLNRACTNLNLSSSELTTPLLRSLVKCFNAYGALDPIDRLLEHMTDEQVGTIAQAVNQYLIRDPSLLYDIEQNFISQQHSGSLDGNLRDVSKFLENSDLISAALTILNASDDTNRAQVLGILQTLGPKLSSDTVSESLSTVLGLTESRAFEALKKNLSTGPGSTYSLKELTERALLVLKESQTPGSYSVLNDLNRQTQAGNLGPALDTILGTTESDIKLKAPSLGAVFPILSDNQGEIYHGLNELSIGLSQPLRCLKKSRTIQDTILDLFAEVSNQPPGEGANFIRREHLLTLVAVDPFCDLPASTRENYSKVEKLASSPAMSGIEDIIRATYAIRQGTTFPLVTALEQFWSDPKTTDYLPFVSELSARGAWPNLILLLSRQGTLDRTRVSKGLAFYSEPSPFLKGESIKDALSDLFVQAGITKAYGLASETRTAISRDNEWMNSLLEDLQSSLATNTTQPYLRITQELFNDAPKNGLLFQTLFSLALTPGFKQSLTLLSQMGADGRLKELLTDSIAIFHGVAIKGAHSLPPINHLTAKSPPRHNLNSSDLSAPISPKPLANSDCEQLKIGVTPDLQWDLYLGCMEAAGKYQDLKQINKAEIGTLSDFIKEMGHDFSSATLKAISDWWLVAIDSGEFNRILDSAAQIIQRRVLRPILDFARPLVSDPKVEKSFQKLEIFAAQTIKDQNFPTILKEIDRLSSLSLDPSATPLPIEFDKSRISRWVDNKECEDLPPGTVARNKVSNVRAKEVFQDYIAGVTSHENPAKNSNTSWTFPKIKDFATPYLSMLSDPEQSLPDHTLMDGILDFLRFFSLNPGESQNVRQHYTREDLEGWFYDRGTDQKLISYYYFDEYPDSHPVVRMVTSLDRLELVLINADFDSLTSLFESIGLKGGMNLGKLAMSNIGDAWGDEPEELWPDEIKKKFKKSRPPTLKEAVEKVDQQLDWLKEGVGFPKTTKCEQESNPNDSLETQKDELSDHSSSCEASTYPGSALPPLLGCINMPDVATLDFRGIKRRIYNIAQVVSVLSENLPGSGTAQAGGMKFLRDLFFQINYSTPLENRDELAGMKNNLSFITFLAKSGIDRQLSFDFRRLPREALSLKGLFGAIVSFSTSPQTPELLDKILKTDELHQIAWGGLEQMLPFLGNSIPDNHPRMDSLYFKQSVYSGLTLLQKWGLIDLVVPTLSKILDEQRPFLTNHLDDLAQILSRPEVSQFLRALSEDRNVVAKNLIRPIVQKFLEDPDLLNAAIEVYTAIDKDPLSKEASKNFENQWDSFKNSTAYRNLKTSQIIRELRDYLESPKSQSVREFVAATLQKGDVDRLLTLVATDPAQIQKTLEILAKYSENGDLKAYIAYLRTFLVGVN